MVNSQLDPRQHLLGTFRIVLTATTSIRALSPSMVDRTSQPVRVNTIRQFRTTKSLKLSSQKYAQKVVSQSLCHLNSISISNTMTRSKRNRSRSSPKSKKRNRRSRNRSKVQFMQKIARLTMSRARIFQQTPTVARIAVQTADTALPLSIQSPIDLIQEGLKITFDGRLYNPWPT